MNILDIEVKYQIHNYKELLFYAKKQFFKYEEIEGIKNWEEYDFSIDCSEDQLKFKDILEIRFVEELTEMTLAIDNLSHFKEELIDSFNFFLSSLIMINFDFSKKTPMVDYLKEDGCIIPSKKDLFIQTYEVIEKVGALCNLLKNRPRSQSNYLVSMLDFNQRLNDLYDTYCNFLNFLHLSKKELFDIFSKKLNVNFFRIESKY